MIDPEMVAEESYMDMCDTLYHSMKKFYQDPENRKPTNSGRKKGGKRNE